MMKKLISLTLTLIGLGASLADTNAKITCPTDVVSQYGCDVNHCFDAGKIYVGSGKALSDNVINNGNLYNFYYDKKSDGSIKNSWLPQLYNRGAGIVTFSTPTFEFTPEYQAHYFSGSSPSNYMLVQPGENFPWIKTKDNYQLGVLNVDNSKLTPGTPLFNLVKSSNFTVVYPLTVNYYDNTAQKFVGSPETLKECQIIGVAWCGDGEITNGEKCDPNAPGTQPGTCDPVSCQPKPATYSCDSITSAPTINNTTIVNTGQSIAFTCNGTNVQQFRLDVTLNGTTTNLSQPAKATTTNQATFNVSFPNTGNYNVQCVALNSNGNPTETKVNTNGQNTCQLPLNVTPITPPAKNYECKGINVPTTTITNNAFNATCYGSGSGIKGYVLKIDNNQNSPYKIQTTASSYTFPITGLTSGNHRFDCYVLYDTDLKEETSNACNTSTTTTTPVNPLACVQITVPTQKLPTNSTANITCQGTGDNISSYTLRVTGPNGFDKTYTTGSNAKSVNFVTDALADGTYSAVCSVSNGATTLTAPTCNAANSIVVGPNAPICQDMSVSKGTANPNEKVVFTCNGGGDTSKIKNYVIDIFQGNQKVDSKSGTANSSFTLEYVFQKGGEYKATCTVYDQNNTPYTSQACSNKVVDVAGFDLSIKKYVNEATTVNSKEDAQDGNPYQVEINKPYSYKVVVKNEGTITTFGETKVVDSEIQAGIKITGTPTGDGWTCTNTENSFTCTSTATIAAGQNFPTINVPALATTTATNLRNVAYVTNPNEKYPLDYPTDSKNKDEANVRTVDSGFDISLKKYISYNGVVYDAEDFGSQDTDTSVNTTTPVQLPTLGTTFDYIIRTKNTGPQTTKDTTTITDRLDQNVELQSINSNGWSCNMDGDKKGFTCTSNAAITAGNFYPEITINAKVTGYGSTRNSATATNPNDKTPNNNTDEANSNTPNSEFFLKIRKYVDKVAPENDAENQSTAIQKNVGDVFNYVLVVTNQGPAASRDVTTITDSATDGVQFTFTNGYSYGGWTCNYVNNSNQNFTCTRSDSIAAGTSYPELVIPAKVVKQTDYIYNNAIVSNPSDHGDNNPAIVKVPPQTNPGGGGGQPSYECTGISTGSTAGEIICGSSAGNKVQVDCGDGILKDASLFENNGSYSKFRATCEMGSNPNQIKAAACVVNGKKTFDKAPYECKIVYKTADVAYPSCRQIDPPSVKLGEKLPVWWALSGYDLLSNGTFTQQDGKGCELTFYQDETSPALGSVRVDCTASISSDNLMRTFLDQNTKFNDGFNVSKSQGGSAWVDTTNSIFNNGKYGEYLVQMSKIYLNKRTYDTNGNPQISPITVDLSRNVCQYNFVMVPGYTVQLGTNIASPTPNIFSQFYRVSNGGYNQIFAGSDILSKIQKSVESKYNGDSINYIFNTFVPNKTNLATVSTPDKFGGSTKTQGQNIYVANHDVTFNDGESFDTPITVIVKGTAYIKGNIKGNLMLIADKIVFTTDSRNAQTTVNGIFIAKNGIESQNFDNKDTNGTWSQDGRLIIRGTLIGDTSNLASNRRPSIDWTNFISTDWKDLQKSIIEGSSLRITTNTELWNALPPGANEMNDIILKSRN